MIQISLTFAGSIVMPVGLPPPDVIVQLPTSDPAIVFARDLLPTIRERRARTRVLNETLFQHRSKFARGLVEWKGQTLAPDANFTLRVTYGRVAGYSDGGRPVP